MNRVRLTAKRLLLISGIGISIAFAAAGPVLAAVQPPSGVLSPTTVVIRGSDPATAQPPSANDPRPIVLRGSPPSAAQPSAAQYACPPGYDYDPSSGCVIPGNAYNPYDYGDWPYYGFDGFSSDGRRHEFRHGFAHGTGRRFSPRFGHHFTNGFGRGYASSRGFGHR